MNFLVHVVFFKCARLRILFFITICTDHRSPTRHPIQNLFDPGGHWRCPLSAHGGPMHVMCTLCTLSVLQCTKHARTITQKQHIKDIFYFFMVVTGEGMSSKRAGMPHVCHVHTVHVHARCAQYMYCQCTQCHNITILHPQ